MSSTAAQIARIKKIQGVFSALALLNMNGHLYPKESNVCDGDTYDYIIVGADSASVVIAARLAAANKTILLIEPGENPGIESQFPGLVTYVKNSRVDWNYTSESDGFTGKCHKAGGSLLGKVLGGSGPTNFMIYGRGSPQDYYGFYKATNDSSWKWQNMLKYFKKSEKLQDLSVLKSAFGKYHSDKGTIGVIKENRSVCDDYLIGFEEAGESVVIDNIGAGILGYSSALYNILDGVRTEGASTYLPPLKDNPNLNITRSSLATKIIFDENKNAVGVEFVKNGKAVTVKARKEVIVSAGPVKSPQLLMLSGIGPKEHLEKMNITVISDLPVGKNLQNVVGALLVFRTNRPAKPEPFNAHNYPAPFIVGYSALNKSSRNPDYETLNFIMDDPSYFLSFCGFTLGFKNSICDKLHLLAENTQMLVTVVSNIKPKSRGEILLNSTDPFAQPKIINGYYSNDHDLDAIVEHILDYIKIEGTPHFQCLRVEFMRATEKCNKFEFGSRAYFRCYALCMIATTGRRCGSCAMGSVVDSKLNVMGVKRLRVADASVMPNTIGSPIYASEVALAEKAAEMILESS